MDTKAAPLEAVHGQLDPFVVTETEPVLADAATDADVGEIEYVQAAAA